MTVLGWVADGNYVPSLGAISVEGESGLNISNVDAPVPLPRGNSMLDFPSFLGRGYAELQFTSSVRVSVSSLHGGYLGSS